MNKENVEHLIEDLTFEMEKVPFIFTCSIPNDNRAGAYAFASNLDPTGQIQFLKAVLKDLQKDAKPKLN